VQEKPLQPAKDLMIKKPVKDNVSSEYSLLRE
jgi:hypothetical protein